MRGRPRGRPTNAVFNRARLEDDRKCRAIPVSDRERGGRRRRADNHRPGQPGAARVATTVSKKRRRPHGAAKWPNEFKDSDACDTAKRFSFETTFAGAKFLQNFGFGWHLPARSFLRTGGSARRPLSLVFLGECCAEWIMNVPRIRFIFFLLTRINAVSYAAHPARIVPGPFRSLLADREFSL